ncbi:hypothetical protein AVEN_240959-1 [Araneus ventricosus]|uniref:Uncharacterized protein n=1 Tax=Araneus ventricosus TaxID=182803 RepID=A0A4Y2K387_ARAVE|nr:hypothetical protein AVEN_240959-1 [Araneus ventricosus]
MHISQHLPPDHGNSFCLVVKMLDSGHKGFRFKATHFQSGDREEHATPTFSPTNRWQFQKSRQFHLLLHSPEGSTTTPTSTPVSQFKVYDTFHSTKPARACAQTIRAAICAYARSTRKCNYRFLDIQIISNKLGDTPVVIVAPSYSVMHISQYLPPDHGKSFCLVVKMLDSGSKGPRF